MLKELRGADKPVSVQHSNVSKSAVDETGDASQALEEQKKKLKELKQRHKLDLEIKENQVRSLKLKLEQYEELIAELKGENEAYRQEHIDMPLQVQHNQSLEKQQKKDKGKLKKYDQVLKRSLGALQ